jgi:hypothetical protein
MHVRSNSALETDKMGKQQQSFSSRTPTTTMLTLIDPTTPPGCTVLVFSRASMIRTKLYAPGADPDVNPTYSVSATELGKHVELSRSGTVIARVDFRGKKGGVVHIGEDKLALGAWAAFGKDGEAKVHMPAGAEYVWRRGEGGKSQVGNKTSYPSTQASTKVTLQLIRSGGDEVIATYVPAQLDNPDQATAKALTRPHIEMRLQGANQDEVVLAILVMQQLVSIMKADREYFQKQLSIGKGAWAAGEVVTQGLSICSVQ